MIKELAIGGTIAPIKNVSASAQLAISEVIQLPKYSDLKPMEASILYNLFKDYRDLPTEEYYGGDNRAYIPTDFGEGLKTQIIKKLDEKFYLIEDSYNDKVYEADKTLGFIDAVNSRVQTRKGLKAGTDLFPEMSGVKEAEAHAASFVNNNVTEPDKTPARTKSILEHLYADHHATWDSIQKAKAKFSESELKKFLDEMYSKELEHHFFEEETELFPSITGKGYDDTIEQIVAEHEYFRTHFKLDYDPQEMAQKIIDHIKFEEKLFKKFAIDKDEVVPKKLLINPFESGLHVLSSECIPEVIKKSIREAKKPQQKYSLPLSINGDIHDIQMLYDISKGHIAGKDEMRENLKCLYLLGQSLAFTDAHQMFFIPTNKVSGTIDIYSLHDFVKFAKTNKAHIKKSGKGAIFEKDNSKSKGMFIEENSKSGKDHSFFRVFPQYDEAHYQSEIDLYALYDYLKLFSQYKPCNVDTMQCVFQYEILNEKQRIGFNVNILSGVIQKFLELGIKSAHFYCLSDNRGMAISQHKFSTPCDIKKEIKSGVVALVMPQSLREDGYYLGGLENGYERSIKFAISMDFKTGKFINELGEQDDLLYTDSLLSLEDFQYTISQYKSIRGEECETPRDIYGLECASTEDSEGYYRKASNGVFPFGLISLVNEQADFQNKTWDELTRSEKKSYVAIQWFKHYNEILPTKRR